MGSPTDGTQVGSQIEFEPPTAPPHQRGQRSAGNARPLATRRFDFTEYASR